MSAEPAWYSPERKPPPPRAPRPPDEVLWSIAINGVNCPCEVRFDGESYGWDVRLNRSGESFGSHDFVM